MARCAATGGHLSKRKKANAAAAMRDRAMLLPAIQARRSSTRLSFSKSVPCNIIVMATGIGRWSIT
jgi:hypothetical protein